MTKFTMPQLLKSAVAAGALLSLGGCMYGSDGYYGDGYVNNSGYDCDPYAPFNDYYACDSGYGFANIGFGGGWYDQYYYPGYGVYVFDRGGRRHAMRDHDRRYWAGQRAEYGGHHARGRNGDGRADRRDRRNDYRDRTRNPQRGNDRDGTRNPQRGYDRDRTRDGQRGNNRDDPRGRDRLGYRPGARAAQPDGTVRTPAVRDRGDRAGRVDRRPPRAVEQPQAQPQPATRPAPTSSSARPEAPRYSPRSGRSPRDRVNDN